jgi:hypothetical protein
MPPSSSAIPHLATERGEDREQVARRPSPQQTAALRRNPAVVKASVIACNGLRQKVIGKDRPLNVHASV